MPRRSRRREKPMGLDSRHIGSTRHTRSAESRVSRSMVFLLCSSAYTSLVKPLFKRVWCLLAWLIENVQLAITVVCCGAFLLALHLYSFLLSHIDYNLPPYMAEVGRSPDEDMHGIGDWEIRKQLLEEWRSCRYCRHCFEIRMRRHVHCIEKAAI